MAAPASAVDNDVTTYTAGAEHVFIGPGTTVHAVAIGQRGGTGRGGAMGGFGAHSVKDAAGNAGTLRPGKRTLLRH